MSKEWLLKPESIRLAKTCITLVNQELGIKLLLSHPEFLTLLNDYAEMLDNAALHNSVNQLNGMAGITSSAALSNATPTNVMAGETVHFRGKDYPRWRDGKQFSGLYRGQPRYA